MRASDGAYCRGGRRRDTKETAPYGTGMRYTAVIILCFLSWVVRAAETTPGTKPDAGGVLIEPREGEIEPGTTLTFTFPTAMVGAEGNVNVSVVPGSISPSRGS